jgi:hypothetical protein
METIKVMRAKHLIPFGAYLERNGQPSAPTLREAGLPSDCLFQPEMAIPANNAWKFRELVSRISGEENIGAKANESAAIADLGDLGSRILDAPTVFRALHIFKTKIATQANMLAIEMKPVPVAQCARSRRNRGIEFAHPPTKPGGRRHDL